ncbi:hypothetical protein [Rhizobium sullae]|uniref:Uncharacterized protein n=1 Tax=Rhizobium sullae TaxID=50338 RepID=A0A4V2V885_RHISU|nr:hypothetical protein [Rhizobium sullae]TCU11774.1 hypothetical protein EV132_117115 [Rhizobium sullae]
MNGYTINCDLELTAMDVEATMTLSDYVSRECFDRLRENGGRQKSIELLHMLNDPRGVFAKLVEYHVDPDDGDEDIFEDCVPMRRFARRKAASIRAGATLNLGKHDRGRNA